MPLLEQAILDTVAYADIFQYPLTPAEIHRYLIGVKASLPEVFTAIEYLRTRLGLLDCLEGYYSLPGKTGLVSVRQNRRQIAGHLWPKAIHYGRLIAHLPFVRMVAVTGSLAMENVEPQADLDYLIVTRGGRLWLARAMVILLVRWAAAQGITICPNYFLSDASLALREQNLFTAHEMVQMYPVSGLNVYLQMRRLNAWALDYLPNTPSSRLIITDPGEKAPVLQRFGELILQSPVFDRLERWEMERKQRKFASISGNHLETDFSSDRCKGHFDGHGNRVLAAFREREEIFQEEVR
jgi:hypothetical protein